MLYVIDDEMLDIWSSTLEGWQAKSINGLVGLELERIMDIAHNYPVKSDELNRFAEQIERWWVICPRQNLEGECEGRGYHCRHIHGKPRD